MSLLSDAKKAAHQFEVMVRQGEKTLDAYRKQLGEVDRRISDFYHVIEFELDENVLAEAYVQVRLALIERRDLKEAITIWSNMMQNVKVCSAADQCQKSDARILKYRKETAEFKIVNGLDKLADPDVTYVHLSYEE